jgi:hypothetical protein
MSKHASDAPEARRSEQDNTGRRAGGEEPSK